MQENKNEISCIALNEGFFEITWIYNLIYWNIEFILLPIILKEDFQK